MNQRTDPGGRVRGRTIKIAAIGDLHASRAPRGEVLDLFARANQEADVLVLCGDLTDQGRPEELQVLVEEMAGVEIPIVAVFGNHDHEAGRVDELAVMLRDRGVHILDGENTVIDDIGFVGIKGFGGGFGRYTIGGFGEASLKAFVEETFEQSIRLETALRTLEAEIRVVVMHHAPIPETLKGESEQLYPFLGSSRFLQPIETYGADVVFHGHSHFGSPEGATPSGIPVYNVARPVLQRAGELFRLWTTTAPDRRAATSGNRPRDSEEHTDRR